VFHSLEVPCPAHLQACPRVARLTEGTEEAVEVVLDVRRDIVLRHHLPSRKPPFRHRPAHPRDSTRSELSGTDP
jgi:hypothetical protein